MEYIMLCSNADSIDTNVGNGKQPSRSNRTLENDHKYLLACWPERVELLGSSGRHVWGGTENQTQANHNKTLTVLQLDQG